VSAAESVRSSPGGDSELSGLVIRAYRYRAPISCTSSLMPGVIVALMVALFR
jgi:hypothetical protein